MTDFLNTFLQKLSSCVLASNCPPSLLPESSCYFRGREANLYGKPESQHTTKNELLKVTHWFKQKCAIISSLSHSIYSWARYGHVILLFHNTLRRNLKSAKYNSESLFTYAHDNWPTLYLQVNDALGSTEGVGGYTQKRATVRFYWTGDIQRRHQPSLQLCLFDHVSVARI